MPSATVAPVAPAAATSTSATSTVSPSRNAAPAAQPPRATDDEILGIISPRKNPPRNTQQLEFDFDAVDAANSTDGLPTAGVSRASLPSAQDENSNTHVAQAANARATSTPEPAHLRATFDANPELRAAWRDASAYRESFATPDAARQATALLADVNHMDALFFSRRPEDHASLARAIANLDPSAFSSLAQAMSSIAAHADGSRTASVSPAPPVAQAFLPVPQATTSAISPNLQPHANASESAPQATFSSNESSTQPRGTQAQARMPVLPETANNAQSTANESQLAFLHTANAAAVEGVVTAIEAQVERLLPEGVAKNARTRVVGEIYREIDEGHQRAIVSLLTGRARQALPGVAKRVLSEWTSTIVSAANERRTRQRTAERRIDIAGSSGAGNDADILNL